MECGWISLTFDDGLDVHLDNVVPTLNAHDLLGTFYTHLSSTAFIRRQAEWKQASRDGHELGNHTIFHPADARKKWVRPGNAIDNYTLDRMRMELEVANHWLQALDGCSERTFAYPCSNSRIGRRGFVRMAVELIGCERTRVAGWIDRMGLDWGSTHQSYESIVGELFIAGRGGGLTRGQPVPPLSCWRMTQLPSVAVDDWSLSELKSQVTNAVSGNTWAILQFHGIGGGHHMDCPLRTFQDFVEWISDEHADRVVRVVDGVRRLIRAIPDVRPAELV